MQFETSPGHVANWSDAQPGEELCEPSEGSAQEGLAPMDADVEPVPDLELVEPPAPHAPPERNSVFYDGIELSMASTLGALRAACQSAGLSRKSRDWR